MTIVFDIDDTLLPTTDDEANRQHCRDICSLYRYFNGYPVPEKRMARVHIVSGRTRDRDDETRERLDNALLNLSGAALHLKPSADMSDLEWKLRCAVVLQPDLIIDNSDTCVPALIKAGFTVLKAPGVSHA